MGVQQGSTLVSWRESELDVKRPLSAQARAHHAQLLMHNRAGTQYFAFYTHTEPSLCRRSGHHRLYVLAILALSCFLVMTTDTSDSFAKVHGLRSVWSNAKSTTADLLRIQPIIPSSTGSTKCGYSTSVACASATSTYVPRAEVVGNLITTSSVIDWTADPLVVSFSLPPPLPQLGNSECSFIVEGGALRA